jgi:hypothetical protein
MKCSLMLWPKISEKLTKICQILDFLQFKTPQKNKLYLLYNLK